MSSLSISDLKSKLRNKSEHDFRKLLIILFEQLGYKEVTHTHGVTEFGKDITFYEVTKMGNEKWIACVVKAFDVNQTNFHEISRQVNECFKKPHSSVSKGRVKIDEVYVITNGVFKANTRDLIAEEIESKLKNVLYHDGTTISTLIFDNKLSKFLEDSKDISLTKFHEHIYSILSSDNSLKLLKSDFNVQINSLESFQIQLRTKRKEITHEASQYLDTKANVIDLDLVPNIEKILSSNKPALIQGIATSGKTTILKQIGLSQLKKNPNSNVFYIELSKLSKDLTIQSVEDFIKNEYLTITGSNFEFNSETRTLLLLDGLDEVVLDAHKLQIVMELIRLQKSFKIGVVITIRDNEFIDGNEAIKNIFDIHELLPLNNTEMIELGRKVIGDTDSSKGFINILKRSQIVNSFPKTPLSTIMLAILFKEKKLDLKELPRNIYELYSKFIDLFLNKWDKTKGISAQFTVQQKEYVLSKIAEYMQRKEIVTISFDELYTYLKQLSASRPVEGLDNPELFLKKVCQRSNILLRNEVDCTFRFFHLTIQEYLAANSLRKKDEEVLKNNYFKDWWLNTNIFYAGKTPDESAILEEISEFKIFPSDLISKLNYVIHTSKVLQAAHLLSKDKRKKVLTSMIKIFDQLNLELIEAFVENDIPRLKLKQRTLLDRIIWSRNFFFEFFSSRQFTDDLERIWSEIKDNGELSDITKYSICFCLSVCKKNADFLIDFAVNTKDNNVRWFRIVDVDIDIKHLQVPNEKLRLKIKRKASQNKKYIQAQFKEALKLHYQSITGVKRDK